MLTADFSTFQLPQHEGIKAYLVQHCQIDGVNQGLSLYHVAWRHALMAKGVLLVLNLTFFLPSFLTHLITCCIILLYSTFGLHSICMVGQGEKQRMQPLYFNFPSFTVWPQFRFIQLILTLTTVEAQRMATLFQMMRCVSQNYFGHAGQIGLRPGHFGGINSFFWSFLQVAAGNWRYWHNTTFGHIESIPVWSIQNWSCNVTVQLGDMWRILCH